MTTDLKGKQNASNEKQPEDVELIDTSLTGALAIQMIRMPKHPVTRYSR